MKRIHLVNLSWLILLMVPGGGIPAQGLENPVLDNKLKNSADFCPVGQVWPGYDPDWIEPGTITGGGQTFFALFDPGDNCACPLGFEISTIDFFMTLQAESVYPLTLSVSMGLREAIPDPDGHFSWLPGTTGCDTPIRDFTIPFSKPYVGFGIALECECFEMGSPAFLFFTVHSALDLPGGLFTAGGGTPDSGRFLTQVDGQWVDMVEAGILTRGPLVVSGFASCCEPPVPAKFERWGSIKALFH